MGHLEKTSPALNGFPFSTTLELRYSVVNGQPSQMPTPPPMQPQMPMDMPRGGYCSYLPDQQAYMCSPQSHPKMAMQQPHVQHQPPIPGRHLPHGSMPMSPRNSPRNPPAFLQAPGTLVLSQALPNSAHAPHPPPVLSHPSHSIGGLTSSPPTPSSASIPNRLTSTSNAFVPRGRRRVTLKNPDGTEVKLENLKRTPAPSSNTYTPTPQGSANRQGSPGTPIRRPASIRIESEKQRKLRLAGEQKEKEKARLEENSGPDGGPPRSLQYSRQLPNGNGPRSQGGQNGGPSTALPSPRLGRHPHYGQPSQIPPPPPMQPQTPPQVPMSMPWSVYHIPYPPDANRRDRKAIQIDAHLPQIVDSNVKALLNKLTMENFESISNQIISWANKSDGQTLSQVVRLVFEKAVDEPALSEMSARLCKRMMEQISPIVQDDGIKNEGKPTAGGQLFRRCLLDHCQEDFERGWVAKEAAAAAATLKASEDEAIKAAQDKGKEEGKEEVALYSDEYYAAQKAKRQGLGLIKFIGELFKLQMLTERIMHKCVQKLLGNVDNPEEEEFESLCKLLGTVGGILDTPKARAHLDVYFARMKELIKSPNVTPRMRYMLQDLVELRERKWVSRNAVAAPTTIAAIHENAAKEKAAAEKESYQRQISMSRGGDRTGDLSNFSKISKAQPMTFGPRSVFAGKKGAENKREFISRTSSSSNMLWMLKALGAESGEPATKPIEPTQRKRLVLQPRSQPVESKSAEETASPVAESESESEEEAAAEVEMSEADALKKIKEDVNEFFAVRNLEDAEVYFKIPSQHHHTLVDKLVSNAVESKEADAKLVSDFFEVAVSKGLCSAQAFEDGFTPIAELIDDIAIDAPKAFQLFALMFKGAKLDDGRRQRLASKSMDSDKLLALIYQLVASDPEMESSSEVNMTPAEARKKVVEDSREFFAVRDVHAAQVYFMLPARYHHLLVEQLILKTILNQRKRPDAQMVSNFFNIAVSNHLCSASSFEDGFASVAETIDDLASSVPQAFQLFVLMIKGAQLNAHQRARLAERFGDREKVNALLQH